MKAYQILSDLLSILEQIKGAFRDILYAHESRRKLGGLMMHVQWWYSVPYNKWTEPKLYNNGWLQIREFLHKMSEYKMYVRVD